MSDRIKKKPRVARQYELSQAQIEDNSIDYNVNGKITQEFDKELQEVIQFFYMDKFNNVSPILKDLIKDAPKGMTGIELIKFLKKEAIRGKGTEVTKDAMDYLDIEQYIMNAPFEEKVKSFAKGGLVEGEDNVPFTKEDPADRVDPNTGRPYSEQMTRLGLQDGGDVTTKNSNSNRDYIYNRFTNEFGYRPEAVIGMLGNFSVESGDTFRHDIIQGELEGNPLVYTEEDIEAVDELSEDLLLKN